MKQKRSPPRRAVSTDDINVSSVSATWGSEISKQALRHSSPFLVVITLYISLRFEFKMAVPTLIALVHDVLMTIGVYSLSGLEVTPATVVALLTILGYSIYDGIVVFDKVHENTRLVSATNRMSYGDMVNLSLNQTLMRSLNTSITALIPITSLLVIGSLILGATTLEEFGLALLIGLAFRSAYSSLFRVARSWPCLKESEPRTAMFAGAAGARAERGRGRQWAWPWLATTMTTMPKARPCRSGRDPPPAHRRRAQRSRDPSAPAQEGQAQVARVDEAALRALVRTSVRYGVACSRPSLRCS